MNLYAREAPIFGKGFGKNGKEWRNKISKKDKTLRGVVAKTIITTNTI